MPERPLRPILTDHGRAGNFSGRAQPIDVLGSEMSPDRGADTGWIAAADGDQLERDIAAIERATAALRRAEPALQSWAEPPAAANAPRPIWLVIGMLLFSTAFVALGAVFAIYVLVG